MDPALVESRQGLSVLKISFVGLTLTATLQLIILLLSGSVALMADTVHNFADALTAVPLAVAFWIGDRPATRRYTYGYGRSEDLAGLFVLFVIAASAALVAYEAVEGLLHPSPPQHAGWVGVAGAVGFLGNELVARYRIVAGRRIGSAALEADGHHARADGLSSLAVVAAAIGVAVGWREADPIFGLVITIAILTVVRTAARDIYRRLMDAVDPGLVDQVHVALGSTPGVKAVDAVRLRWIGHRLHAEAEITSDAALTLAAAHDIGELAHHRLLHELPRLTSATIHSNPSAGPGRNPHERTAHHVDPVLRSARPISRER